MPRAQPQRRQWLEWGMDVILAILRDEGVDVGTSHSAEAKLRVAQPHVIATEVPLSQVVRILTKVFGRAAFDARMLRCSMQIICL